MTHPQINPTTLLIAVLNEIGATVEVSPESLEWAAKRGAVTTWDVGNGYLGTRADERPIVGDA